MSSRRPWERQQFALSPIPQQRLSASREIYGCIRRVEIPYSMKRKRSREEVKIYFGTFLSRIIRPGDAMSNLFKKIGLIKREKMGVSFLSNSLLVE